MSAEDQAVQEVRDDQPVGETFLANTDLMVTDSTNTGVGTRNECENLERGDGNQVIQNVAPVRTPLLECTHLLNTSLGTISMDHNRNLKGHRKRRARMQSNEKREDTIAVKDALEGESIKREREENELNILKNWDMQPVRKGKVECGEGITLHSEVEETNHKWS